MALNREENSKSDRVRGPERPRAASASTGTAVQRMLASQSAVGNTAVVQMLLQAGHLRAQDQHQHEPGAKAEPEQAAARDGAAYAAGATTAPSLTAQRKATASSHQTIQRVADATGEHVGEGEGLLRGGHTVQRAGGRGSSSRDGGHSGRSSARPPRIRVSTLPHVHYIQLPTYGPTFGRGGGTRGRVILGPRGFLDQRSDANSQLPPAIVDARATYTNETFIAGHLVNACFGGDGRRSANLTILTSSANGQMKSFDNSIKLALDNVSKIYEHLSRMSVDITPLRLGVEVDVSPAGERYTWDTHGPGKYISKFIHCVATVRGAGLLEDWITAELTKNPSNPDWLYVRGQLDAADRYIDYANTMGMIDNEPRHPIAPAQSRSRRR